jgi:hypothetical protein
MDARSILKTKMPSRCGAKSPARSGRTLAEMADHIFRQIKTGDIIRLDVGCGGVGLTRPQVEPAEWAKGWRSYKAGYRSGAAGKCAHVLDAVLHREAIGRSGAKETRCYADS